MCKFIFYPYFDSVKKVYNTRVKIQNYFNLKN